MTQTMPAEHETITAIEDALREVREIAAREGVEPPTSVDALVQATQAALDRATAAVLEDLDRLTLQIQDLQASIVQSGERAKSECSAHLAIAKEANEARKLLAQHIVELRSKRARLVAAGAA